MDRIWSKVKSAFWLFAEPCLLVITLVFPIVLQNLDWFHEGLSNYSVPIGIIGFVFIFLFSSSNIIYKVYEKRKQQKNIRARTILSHINLLHELKSELIRDSTYRPFETNHQTPLFYNVHGYIRDICKNLRDTIAAIIESESEFVDVALIYKYHDSEKWKWLSGKSGTSSANELNKFVKEPTLFNYIINEKQIVFENQKKDCKFYLPKRRDTFFNNKGSVMAMPLTYFNNRDGLIDLVLVISTYGVQFVESKNRCRIDKFRNVLIYEILPYYISLFQTAFGEMYIRHIHRHKNGLDCD